MVEELLSKRQQELLEHAVELVREGGLQGLTVRRLAERVGFSEAALYRHFPSKTVLLGALVEHLGEGRLLPAMRRIAARSELDPAERIARLLIHHLDLIVAIDGLPVLFLAEAAASGEPELLDTIRRVVSTELELLEGLLAELPDDPTRPPHRELALLFFGLPAATALQLRLLPGKPLDPETRHRLARFYVRQLLAPRSEESP